QGAVGGVAGEEPGPGPTQQPIGAQLPQQAQGQGDEAILGPLALPDVKDHAGAVDVGDAQVQQLVEAQAAAVGGLQQDAVAARGGGVEQAQHLVGAEHAGQGPGPFAEGDEGEFVGPAEGGAVQEAQGTNGLVERAPRHAALEQVQLVGANVVGA